MNFIATQASSRSLFDERPKRKEKKVIHTGETFRIESVAHCDVYSGLGVGWVSVPRGSDSYKKAVVAAAKIDMIPNISKY